MATGFYAFREVEQHWLHGTRTTLEWIDRIGDAVCPAFAALGLMALL